MVAHVRGIPEQSHCLYKGPLAARGSGKQRPTLSGQSGARQLAKASEALPPSGVSGVWKEASTANEDCCTPASKAVGGWGNPHCAVLLISACVNSDTDARLPPASRCSEYAVGIPGRHYGKCEIVKGPHYAVPCCRGPYLGVCQQPEQMGAAICDKHEIALWATIGTATSVAGNRGNLAGLRFADRRARTILAIGYPGGLSQWPIDINKISGKPTRGVGARDTDSQHPLIEYVFIAVEVRAEAATGSSVVEPPGTHRHSRCMDA